MILCLSSLRRLLPPPGATPRSASLPPRTMLRLVELLRAVSLQLPTIQEISQDVTAAHLLFATAELTSDLCAWTAPYAALPGAAEELTDALLSSLSSLAAAPLLDALPRLRGMSPASLVSPPPLSPLSPESMPILSLALEAAAALPCSIGPASLRMRHVPAAFIFAAHAAHIAATTCTSALSGATVAAVAALFIAMPTSTEIAADAAKVARGAVATVLSLLELTPPLQRAPLLKVLLTAAAALPPTDASALEQVLSPGLPGCMRTRPQPALDVRSSADDSQVYGALRILLSAGVVEQRIALAALQAELQRAAATPKTHALGYLRALLPDVGALLLRSTPLTAADKPAALRLMLLACAVAPADAFPPLLSMALPLVVGCLSLCVRCGSPRERSPSEAPRHCLVHPLPCLWSTAFIRRQADGTQSAAQRELSALAHSSLTALAKRSPDAFRAVAANFSPDVRTRMETALREAAAVASAQAQAACCVAASATSSGSAAPSIALKMDFSSFGKS